MLALFWGLRRAHPGRVNTAFRKLQIVSSAFMATSHGTNDAQKTMGIITLALFAGHHIPDLSVPGWVKVSCALVMALGTAMGGWKIVRTMGHKIFKLEAVHGFSAETAAAGRHLCRLGVRGPDQHDPHDLGFDSGGGRLQAPVGRALGRCREHGHRLGADPAGHGGHRGDRVFPAGAGRAGEWRGDKGSRFRGSRYKGPGEARHSFWILDARARLHRPEPFQPLNREPLNPCPKVQGVRGKIT